MKKRLKKKPKRLKLTVKQRKLIQGMAKGLSATEAAKRAGYSKKAAGSVAHETLRNPDVRGAFLAILEKEGLTDKKLAEAILNNLAGNNQFVTQKGRVVNFKDGHLKDKAITQVAKMRALYAPKDVNVEVGGLNELLAKIEGE